MNFHRTMVEAMNESGFSQKNGNTGGGGGSFQNPSNEELSPSQDWRTEGRDLQSGYSGG